MPRSARLDIPGLLQHVIVRGIEKRDIFIDDKDRRLFLRRFAELLTETETECLAWALMPNHAHLLLRPKRQKLAIFMRRLLTGYAVTFNLRHQRVGHLFQNRYKSIVCEEDPYLLELVRYIHLNPLRAGIVKDMNELSRYSWSGHAVLLGNRQLSGQVTGEILAYFGRRLGKARKRYRAFVMEGMPQGRRDELVGGGKRRSLKQSVSLPKGEAYDQRVLGSGEFIDRLRREKDLATRIPSAMGLLDLADRVAAAFATTPEALKRRCKARCLTEARAVLCYLAVRELGHNGAELGRMLSISRSGVSIAANRGERIVQNEPSVWKRMLDS